MKSSSNALVTYGVAWALLAVVGVCAAYYVFSSVPPYGFYYDLGANIAAVSHIARWMHGVADVWDSLGWAGWGERTAFTYAPMTAYVIAVPIAKIFGDNAFAAVKAMQVLDLFAAWASAGYLYAVLRGRTPWAWIAGLVYALLPEQLLMLRGNMEFGLVSALAPLLFAWPLVLIRRYGLRALPFCGALAGLLSTDLVVEYAIFAGIPACFVAVCAAYDRARRLKWFVFSALAFATFLAVAAYTAVPTFASHALFMPPATVDAALQGGEFSKFAESPLALVSLLLNESMANQRAEFSLGWMLWICVPIGVLLWGLAIGWVVRCARRRAFAPGELALVIGAGICVLVALGDQIPGVGLVWWLIAHLPGLNMVRTPDRFIVLAVPIVVVCAVSSLEYLLRRERARTFALASLGALVVASAAMFFLLRIFLGDTLTIEDRQPHFDRINAIAESRDNRAANLALVDGGSVFDTSLYAMMMPGVDFADDFTQRYEGDGLGGTGMLARANVATIVSSPPWTKDSPLLAASSIARASFLHPLEGDATTVTAFGVDPVRGYVHPTEQACLDGGPGMLDYVEALPLFAASAFVPNGTSCTRTLYTDSAPAAALLGGRIVVQIAGVTLFPHSGVLRDIDYRIALGRFFLNVPWYRNAIDGDSPQIGDGAVSLDPKDAGSASFSVKAAGVYAAAIRAVCHGEIHGTLAVDGRAAVPFVCPAARGFSWTKVPLGALEAGAHRLSMSVGDIDASAPVAQTTWHFGVDGVALVATQQPPPEANAGSAAFAFSAARFDSSLPQPPAAALSLVAAPGFDVVGGSQLLARAPDAYARYRFAGPSGRYRIAAAAYMEAAASGGSYLGIFDGNHCCTAIATYSRDRGTQVYAEGDASLRPGDIVTIVLHTTANDPVAVSQLLSVDVQGDPKRAVADEGRSHYGAWFDWVERSKHDNPQVPGGPTPVPGFADLTPYFGQPLWTNPITLSVAGFPAETRSSPTSFTALVVGVGAVDVRLTCGDETTTALLTPPGGDVTLPHAQASDCSVRLSSQTPGIFVQRAAITRAIVRLDLHARRWIAAGAYRVQPIRRGAGPSSGTVLVDGRPAGLAVTIARSGWHRLDWNRAPADAYLVAFVPLAWPNAAPAVTVVQDASQRWSIHVDRAVTLESAVLWDGNWHLAGASGAVAGGSCDLENTCFANVPPGDYKLWHSWPGYIFIGFAITLAAWALSGWMLVAAAKRT